MEVINTKGVNNAWQGDVTHPYFYRSIIMDKAKLGSAKIASYSLFQALSLKLGHVLIYRN